MNHTPFTPLLRRIALMALMLAGVVSGAAQTEPTFTEKYETTGGMKVPVCTMKKALGGTVSGTGRVSCLFGWKKVGIDVDNAANFFTLTLIDISARSFFADLEAREMQCGLMLDNGEVLVARGSVEFTPVGNGPVNSMKGDLIVSPDPLLVHNVKAISLLPAGLEVPYVIELAEEVTTAPTFAAMSERIDVMLQTGIDEARDAAAAAATAAEEKKAEQYANTLVEAPAVRPSFPGGPAALMRFMAQNLRYPARAQEQGVQGRVMVEFIVEADGSLTNARVVRSVSPDLDREALRLVSLMPRWTPGKKDGYPVRVRYTYPFDFRLK